MELNILVQILLKYNINITNQLKWKIYNMELISILIEIILKFHLANKTTKMSHILPCAM